jgi:hypothetical protein
VSPRPIHDKPLSPGGYVTPWRVRLFITVVVVAVAWVVGQAGLGILVLAVLLVLTDVYWRRRRR